MPTLSVTGRVRENGIQTWQKVMRQVPSELRGFELEYLDARDFYTKQLAIIAQFQEALHQAKADGNEADAKVFSGRIHSAESRIVDMRRRVQMAAERSYAEAFQLAAEIMLDPDVRKAIHIEAERLIGRPRHELRSKGRSTGAMA